MRNIIRGQDVVPTTVLREELERLRVETEQRVADFLRANSLRYILALIGGSDGTGIAVERDCAILTDFFETLPDRELYTIQTGGTKDGLPQHGIEMARAYDMPTIGVHPYASRSYALKDGADLVIQTPDVMYGRTTFGSETPTFVNLVHAAVILGGGYGTRTEASTILKVNKGIESVRKSVAKKLAEGQEVPADMLEKLRPPIYLCPIIGTGKTADELALSTPLEDVGDCMPEPAVSSGHDAALFISGKLAR